MAGQLQSQMRHRDKEMVPRVLVVAMFSLMIASVALVAFAQITGRPNTGVLVEAPIVEEIAVTLVGDRSGHYVVLNDSGEEIANSAANKDGFIGVIGKVIDRERMIHGTGDDQPINVVRRENENIAILDPATGMVIELIGYGADNVAAFAKLLDQKGT